MQFACEQRACTYSYVCSVRMPLYVCMSLHVNRCRLCVFVGFFLSDYSIEMSLSFCYFGLHNIIIIVFRSIYSFFAVQFSCAVTGRLIFFSVFSFNLFLRFLLLFRFHLIFFPAVSLAFVVAHFFFSTHFTLAHTIPLLIYSSSIPLCRNSNYFYAEFFNKNLSTKFMHYRHTEQYGFVTNANSKLLITILLCLFFYIFTENPSFHTEKQ